VREIVRTPHPENMSSDIKWSATIRARSSGTIPDHSRWPMFEVIESMDRLSPSSPTM